MYSYLTHFEKGKPEKECWFQAKAHFSCCYSVVLVNKDEVYLMLEKIAMDCFVFLVMPVTHGQLFR
jgi:hypothetical protein